MTRVVFTRAARHDIQEAFRWYEGRSAGLGAGFLAEVDAAKERLQEDPLMFRLERSKYRRIRLKRFPYSLHFGVAADGSVTVLACLHFRQSPTRWPGA